MNIKIASALIAVIAVSVACGHDSSGPAANRGSAAEGAGGGSNSGPDTQQCNSGLRVLHTYKGEIEGEFLARWSAFEPVICKEVTDEQLVNEAQQIVKDHPDICKGVNHTIPAQGYIDPTLASSVAKEFAGATKGGAHGTTNIDQLTGPGKVTKGPENEISDADFNALNFDMHRSEMIIDMTNQEAVVAAANRYCR